MVYQRVSGTRWSIPASRRMLARLGHAGAAVVVEVAGGVADQAGGDHGVQRVDGVPVDLVRDGGPVDDLCDRLADGRLARPGVLGVEDQVADLGAGALDELEILVGGAALEVDDVRGGESAVGEVDLPVLQGFHHLVRVLEVADGDRVVVALGEAPVAPVADEDRLLALLVGLEAVGPRPGDPVVLAQGVGRVVVGVDDRHRGGGQDERERGVGLVEVEDDLARAEHLNPFEAAEETGRTAADVDLPDAVDGVLDGGGVQGVAVGEREVRAQFAAVVAIGLVGERALLGRVGLRGGRAVGVAEQGLVDVAEQFPRPVPGGGRVQGARGAGGAHHDRSLVLGRPRGEDAATGDQGYGRDRSQVSQASVPVEHAHAPRSAVPRVGRPYRSTPPVEPSSPQGT